MMCSGGDIILLWIDLVGGSWVNHENPNLRQPVHSAVQDMVSLILVQIPVFWQICLRFLQIEFWEYEVAIHQGISHPQQNNDRKFKHYQRVWKRLRMKWSVSMINVSIVKICAIKI